MSYELKVKVTPNARQNAIVGFESGLLKIRIHAAPEKGQANDELVRFLIKILTLKPADVVLVSGHTQRIKKLIISLSQEEIVKRVEASLDT